MGWIAALFYAFQTPVGMFHTAGEPPVPIQPQYVCATEPDENGEFEFDYIESHTIPANTLQMGSFTCDLAPGSSPYPTPTPTITPTPPDLSALIVTPVVGGPAAPAGYYCINKAGDDVCTIEGDLVPKGDGGTVGTCGTVIDQAHKLVASLPQVSNSVRDSLNPKVEACHYNTGVYASPDYVSSFFVIDAYNLAGHNELSKANPDHADPSKLFAWWHTNPAGYRFLSGRSVIREYGSGQTDLTGCAIFLDTGAGIHVGIVNNFELYTEDGDGILSILQSGTSMYVDRIAIGEWAVVSPVDVQGFGCRAD